jgi:hypothetical protein
MVYAEFEGPIQLEKGQPRNGPAHTARCGHATRTSTLGN